MIDARREKLLSLKEAAVRLGVTDRAVRNWIGDGRLEALRFGGCIRTSEEAIARFARPAAVAESDKQPTAAQREHEEALRQLREEHGMKV